MWRVERLEGLARARGRSATDLWHAGCMCVAAGDALVLPGVTGEDLLVISLLTRRGEAVA
jgi:hypothetical protein